MKVLREIFGKLGIQSKQDLLYFIGMILLIGYLLTVLLFSIKQRLNPQLIFYEKFILFRSNIQFPVFTVICIALMSISFCGWLIVGIARFFDKQRHFSPLDPFESLFVSILIPAHNEERVIQRILNDLSQQYYRRLEIIVIAHNCSDKTIEKAKSIKDGRIKIVNLRTRRSGKALALNRGLEEAKGSIIVNLDADNKILDRDFIVKIVQYFRDMSVSGVQAALGVANNKDNILTMFQRMEFDAFMNIFWRGRRALGLPCFLAGTGTAIRTSILHKYGGWKNSSLVEDFDLFTKLSFGKENIVYASELKVLDEKPTSWTNLIEQRARWLKGYLIVVIENLIHFDNLVDYLYRLFPLSIFAWWGTTFLYIFYSLTGQVSLVNINNWIWISWTLILVFFLFFALWPKRKLRTIFLLPLYWFFTYHLFFVVIASLFTSSWSHTKHFGEEV